MLGMTLSEMPIFANKAKVLEISFTKLKIWLFDTELSNIWSLRSTKITEMLISSKTDLEIASWIPIPMGRWRIKR